jgi:hypothetical protein
MADANARLERLRRRNAVRGQTEPIFHRQDVSAEEEEEEDLESSYLPSGRTQPSLSFTTTATSRARSGSQLSPVQALAMAQELLRYQPTADGREGWRTLLARKTAAQHQDNRRAFVTTNGCFPSKATKDPLTFVEERRPLFSAKRQRLNQTLGLLGHGRELRTRKKHT